MYAWIKKKTIQVKVILLDIRTQRDGYHAFNIAHRKFKFAAMIGAMLRCVSYNIQVLMYIFSLPMCCLVAPRYVYNIYGIFC